MSRTRREPTLISYAYECCKCKGRFSMALDRRRRFQVRSGARIWCPHCGDLCKLPQEAIEPWVAMVLNHAVVCAQVKGEPEEGLGLG